MIAVTAIPERSTLRELTEPLSDAGWVLHDARDADEVVAHCRRLEVDVVLLDEEFAGEATGVLGRLKGDPDLFGIAVVLVGDGLDRDYVTEALESGAIDVLRTPVDPAEAVARASAAARTKALVKELTQQNTRLEGLMFFDELTGLRNRRAILNDLDMLLATARRHERSLAAVMIDIDRFKAINDEHGHRAGDAVLRGVARRLEHRLRRADLAGRLGGDELLALLPETDADGAATLADAIREEICAAPIQTPAGPIAVTVSLGSAAWDGEASELLLERADGALYAAKAAGRDRAVAA